MEGPSLVILAEELHAFIGQKVRVAEGNTKIGKERFSDQNIQNILSWGKHLIIQFETFAVRIHFLMFGSYRINERRINMTPRLSLIFDDGELNFYSCSVKFIEPGLVALYNWKIDIMSDTWDEKLVTKKVKLLQEEFVCDVLMSQEVFAGVGNIIKNEVLFNVRLHPLSKIKNIPPKLIKQVVAEARGYSFKFYTWKKEFQLRKHWQIYRKRICPRCAVPIEIQKTGKGQRRSFFCSSCQLLFQDDEN